MSTSSNISKPRTAYFHICTTRKINLRACKVRGVCALLATTMGMYFQGCWAPMWTRLYLRSIRGCDSSTHHCTLRASAWHYYFPPDCLRSNSHSNTLAAVDLNPPPPPPPLCLSPISNPLFLASAPLNTLITALCARLYVYDDGLMIYVLRFAEWILARAYINTSNAALADSLALTRFWAD
jgi:hypothetical protein